jgi:hypothetical protein
MPLWHHTPATRSKRPLSMMMRPSANLYGSHSMLGTRQAATLPEHSGRVGHGCLQARSSEAAVGLAAKDSTDEAGRLLTFPAPATIRLYFDVPPALHDSIEIRWGSDQVLFRHGCSSLESTRLATMASLNQVEAKRACWANVASKQATTRRWAAKARSATSWSPTGTPKAHRSCRCARLRGTDCGSTQTAAAHHTSALPARAHHAILGAGWQSAGNLWSVWRAWIVA